MRGTLAAVVVSLLLAACTVETTAGPLSPTPAPSPVPSPEQSTPASPTEQPEQPEPDFTQPLVITVGAASRPRNISEARARRVVAGTARGWERAEMMPASRVGPQVQVVRVSGVDPMREPNRYPIRTAAPRSQQPVVTVSVVGDIMLGRGVGAAARAAGVVAPQLRPMRARLSAADITVGNLESTLSRAGAPTQGGDSFAADPRVARALRAAGFDALSLANNHAGDFGDRALVQTVRRLRAGGVRTFGAGASPRVAWQPVVLDRAGVRFGFLGFNAIGETPEVGPGQPGAVSVSMPPRTGPLDRAELDRFLRAVSRLGRTVDVVVVLPHWGTQYTNVPEPIQRMVARRLVGSGADLVVGGHPHWVQGTEMVDGRLVVHSLGNYVFDMDFSEETQKGLVLELTYWGSDLKSADFVPYQMDETFTPRVVSWRRGLETLRLMWETSGPAFRRAR